MNEHTFSIALRHYGRRHARRRYAVRNTVRHLEQQANRLNTLFDKYEKRRPLSGRHLEKVCILHAPLKTLP